jgi:hypothetical protein
VSSTVKALPKDIPKEEVRINVVRQSDRLIIFYIDGSAFFPEIGSFFKDDLFTIEKAYGLSNKAIAVVTNCRLDKQQFEPLKRLVMGACRGNKEKISFRTLRKDTQLAEELKTLLAERVRTLPKDL